MKQAVAFLLLSHSCWTAVAQEGGKKPEPYTHLVYVRTLKVADRLKSELVVHRLHPIADAGKADAIRSLGTPPSFCRLAGVLNGNVVIRSSGNARVDFVNLKSGKKISSKSPGESIQLDATRNCVFFCVPGTTLVKRFAPATLEEVTVFSGIKDRPANLAGFGHGGVALSPDGKILAVATLAEKGEQDKLWHDRFVVHLVDVGGELRRRRVKRVFRGATMMTGGGDYLEAPAMLWDEDGGLLVASTVSEVGTVVIGGRGGDEKAHVWSVDPQTLKTELMCEAPGAVRVGITGPTRFAQRSDGVLQLHTAAGLFRIDLEKKQSHLDKSLSKHFALSGEQYQPRLTSKKRRLAKRVNLWDVSVSPDGEQAIWRVPVYDNPTAWSWTSAPKQLFHSLAGAEGVKIGVQQFDSSGTLWLRQSDL